MAELTDPDHLRRRQAQAADSSSGVDPIASEAAGLVIPAVLDGAGQLVAGMAGAAEVVGDAAGTVAGAAAGAIGAVVGGIFDNLGNS